MCFRCTEKPSSGTSGAADTLVLRSFFDSYFGYGWRVSVGRVRGGEFHAEVRAGASAAG
jgi:hypothetical protein